ncbi:hypothetical protein ACVBIL_09990 [Shewanella sp. 125m-7]
MRKQIAYLAFFISLVGQFLLSPAMAMPKFLHASSHITQQQLETKSILQSPALALLEAQLSSEHQTGATINCDSKMPNVNFAKVDCDALCEMLGASDCVSSSVSAPGIVEQEQLMLTAQSSMASLQTRFWSLQTVDLSSVNPPPIHR